MRRLIFFMRKTLSALVLIFLFTGYFYLTGSDYYQAIFPQNFGSAVSGGADVIITIEESDVTDPVLKDLFGVIAGPDPSVHYSYPDLTEHFHDVGVTAVRNNDYFDDRLDIELMFNCGGLHYPSWETCDPNDPSNYDWTISDAQFQSWIDGGFEPFLRLGGESTNVDRRYDFYGPQNTKQEDNWIVAAKTVTGRYLYWQGQGPRYEYGDIWTEFPGKFWDRTDQEFIDFYLKAYVELKAAYPELKWGGPGFNSQASGEVLNGDGGVALDLLTQAYEKNIHLDWLGWHVFSNQAARWGSVAQAYDELLHGEGRYSSVPWADDGYYDNTEVIVDAYGLDPSVLVGASDELIDQTYNGPIAAAVLTGAFIQMQYADLDGAYYYRGGDIGEQESRSGLFHGDQAGSYKPLSYAFKLWSTMYKDYPELVNVSLSQQGKLFVMAAQNSNGKTALLISNPTDKELSWVIKGKKLDFTYTQVDGTLTGSEVQNGTNSKTTIPAYGVQYVILGSPSVVTTTPSKPTGPTHPVIPTTPTDPGSTPTDPTTPVDPVTAPTDPVATPTDPGTTPVDNTGGTTAVATTVSSGSSGGGGGGGGGGSSSSSSSGSSSSSSSTSSSAALEDGDCEPPFTDISSHWGKTYIEDLFCQGVVQGKSTLTFAPNDSTSRAELTKMALLASGQEVEDSATEPFTDVLTSDWFYGVISTSNQKGYVEGYDGGLFSPNKAVNRAEALTLLFRVFAVQLSSGSTSPFKDVSPSSWYFPAVYTAYTHGIVEGYNDGTFGGSKNITRAEVAAIVIRMQEAFE
jgi:hypothetical protein